MPPLPLPSPENKTKLNVKFILEFKFKFRLCGMRLTLKFAYAMAAFTCFVCSLFLFFCPQPPKNVNGVGWLVVRSWRQSVASFEVCQHGA